jgi:RHS repeat-associated protein
MASALQPNVLIQNTYLQTGIHRMKQSLSSGKAWRNAIALSIFGICLLASWQAHAQVDEQVRVSSFEYNDKGKLTKEVIEPDSPQDCLQSQYTYDAVGNRNSIATSTCSGAVAPATASAEVPRITRVNYPNSPWVHSSGLFPLESVNALGQTTTQRFSTLHGAQIASVDANQIGTWWVYDSFGNKTRETRPDGTYTLWAYKLCSDPRAATLASPAPNCPIEGVQTQFPQWAKIEQTFGVNGQLIAPPKYEFYDAADRMIRTETIGYDGASYGSPTSTRVTQDFYYSARGLITGQSEKYWNFGTNSTLVWTTSAYDVLGRLTEKSTPDADVKPGGNKIVRYEYDGLTSRVRVTGGLDEQVKTTIKNAQGLVAEVIDAQGGSVKYQYDALGQLLETNANGQITQIRYNRRGQKIKLEDATMGQWLYSYNAYGELISQRDSLKQSSTMTYDVLGRMRTRLEPDLISKWFYDANEDKSACGSGIGKLCEASAANKYNRKHIYDGAGRIASTATVLDNPSQPAVVSVAYDANTGRMASRTWPTGYKANYSYTPLGYLQTITGSGAGATTASYSVRGMDWRGNITSFLNGNKLAQFSTYNASGRLTSINVSTEPNFGAGPNSVQRFGQGYTYDGNSNLLSRQDTSTTVSEAFTYDKLNRLVKYLTVSPAVGSTSMNYDIEVGYSREGHIFYKSDVGTYYYDWPAHPGRLIGVGLDKPSWAQSKLTGTRSLFYAYDDARPGATQLNNGTVVGNGNLFYTVSQEASGAPSSVRWENYTSFNMPQSFNYGLASKIGDPTNGAQSNRTLTFVYGPEHQRITQRVEVANSAPAQYLAGAGTTWYLNGEDSLGLSYEKEVKPNGMVEHKHYLSANGTVFALQTTRSGPLGTQPASSLRYMHHDHMGSAAATTDEAGTIVERLAYDPWGKRRYPSGQADTQDQLVGQSTDRGFTMHEHLDEVGVIHMNGRIYDPLVGRFMSADTVIPYANDLQAYNRYAYSYNNPLKFDDPTGHSPASIGIETSPDFTREGAKPIGAGVSFNTCNRTPGGGIDIGVQGPVPGLTGYAKISLGIHTILSVAGAIPAVGVIPDAIDLLYTAGELPSGHSSKTDVGLGVAGIATTFLPGPVDIGAAVAKNLNRAADAKALLANAAKNAEAAKEVRALAEPAYKTTKEAKLAAETLGFKKINETVHEGQAVFKRGKDFITRDLDGHNGGAWKMADSVKNLGSKETRFGTFDINLNRIGD